MNKITRGLLIDINLDPSRRSETGKIHPSEKNGLFKISITDCLQTRPVDYRARIKGVRGELESETIEKIDQALKVVFDLN